MFHAVPRDNTYLSESLADYHQDFAELHALLSDSINRLKQFLADIGKTKKYISSSTYEEMKTTADSYIHACRTHDRLVTQHVNTLEEADKIKKTVYEFLRTHQTLFGALITCTDWQSPSFLHTSHSQAGRQTNSIYATINDYKRDQHWDAYKYEQAYLKHNIDGLIKFPIHVQTTSSGMAAFTTILNYLMLEHKVTRPVVIGKNVYFENKTLITQAFADRLIEVDESQTNAVIQAIDKHNPSVIFFDSLANSPDIAVPDLIAITQYLIKNSKEETFLVIDNTCLSVMFQPFRLFLGRRTKLRLILFESLNKYHQFGFDRVTGGILWGYGGDTAKLFDYRVHLGTNILDSAVSSLPAPNRNILTKRLLRHQRNATIIATRLQQWVDDNPQGACSAIVFPALPHHPAYAWTKKYPFCGSYFTIGFKKRFQNVRFYKKFVTAVIQKAKKQHVDLVSGTSFGMNTTRIYLTAVRSKPNTPFVRIAVGTESRQAIEAIITVLIESLSLF